MKRFILAASLMLLAATADAQRIIGPDTAQVDQELRLGVDGLAAPSFSDGIDAVANWVNGLKVRADAPPTAEAYLEPDVALNFGKQAVKLRILFSANKPGVYVIALTDGKELLTKRIVVGGTNPQPPPTPVTTGRRQIILVRETQDNTPQMNITELSFRSGTQAEYLKSKGHFLVILSDDRPPPPKLQAVFDKTKAVKLPALAILDADSLAELFVGSIEPDIKPDALLDLIKKHGG